MTNETNPMIPVELHLDTWRFIRDLLLSLKRSAEQPARKGYHRSHTLRLIDGNPHGYAMLALASYAIANSIWDETEDTEGPGGTSVHPPIETTFPEVKHG